MGSRLRSAVKAVAVRSLSRPLVCRLFSPLTRDRATIFMLHRFECPDLGVRGTTPRFMRDTLDRLRRAGYRFTSIERIFDRLAGNGLPLGNAVAFTLDDGFQEQATVAAPLFLEFDCPLTLFLISGFIDGYLWPWDSKVKYLFEQTRRREIHCAIGSGRVFYDLERAHGRNLAAADFIDRCKATTVAQTLRDIARLAAATQVALPAAPPPAYRPLSWSDARHLERRGVTFGPHTVSHFTLSQWRGEEARVEVAESWRRLRAELTAPLPVFCYPTGRRCDYGPQDVRMLEAAGFRGALTATAGYASPAAAARPGGRYQVGRFGFPDNPLDVIQCCSWIEQGKELLRGRLRRMRNALPGTGMARYAS